MSDAASELGRNHPSRQVDATARRTHPPSRTIAAGSAADRLGPARRREVPRGRYTLIISFGDPLMVDGERHLSFLAGLHDRPVFIAHAGARHGIEVRLGSVTAGAL
jgi:hypothetical protein